MIVNAWGVVLSRRHHGEADRLCSIYTEGFGRLSVRFVGVNKPGRKLKALSEPLVWGEYRLYLSPKSEWAKAVGGKLIGCYPGIREDLRRTVDALSVCELVSSITAERSPNPQKYELITEALRLLDEGPRPWLTAVFGLRLLDLAGFGLPEGDALQARLREGTLEQACSRPWDEAAHARLQHAVRAHAEAQSGRALRCPPFAEKTLSREEPAPC